MFKDWSETVLVLEPFIKYSVDPLTPLTMLLTYYKGTLGLFTREYLYLLGLAFSERKVCLPLTFIQGHISSLPI